MIEAVVLGCGTSHGVPVIGCGCAVCTSDSPKNNRTRSGLLLESHSTRILIDAPPELRLQLTRENVSRLDAVIITHSHADHIMGLDDLRRFNEISGKQVTLFAQPSVLEDVRRVFRYAFDANAQKGGGLPRFELAPMPDWLDIGDVRVQAFEVQHGRLPVLGLRMGGLAYLTDVSEIPPLARARLNSLDTLIVDATRYAPHPTHFHFQRAIEVAQEVGARQTYLTHLSHDYDYDAVQADLPEGIALSYDGLRIPIEMANSDE